LKRNPFEYIYKFEFEDGHVTEYPIVIDPVSLNLIPNAYSGTPAEWTRLDFKQCANCPLTPASHPDCPIAVNIMELVETFKSLFSYHDCMVVCKTAERSYLKKTSVMEGLSAIFGIIMATSDCPRMEFLKPMARFHLPFATIEETMVRTASMFLMAHYFKHKDDPGMRFDFKILEDHYAQVQQVNEGLLERINSVGSEDADKNAIITLHSLSQFLSMEIDYSLASLEYIFTGRYGL
jgi:Domain of unknown function (DUF6901)